MSFFLYCRLLSSLTILPLCLANPITKVASRSANNVSVTTTTYVGYVGDPNGRGTASLVISCLLTLILCVWSALHLNVPEKSRTRWYCIFINARRIATGICAPELVVFTAWRQWSSARILGNILGDQAKDTNGAKTSLTRNPWTLTHSFFASTGGFVYDVDPADGEGFLPAGSPGRVTLTARGMALLAQCGHLPDIPEAEITDKSKANDVAKALVLLQASWMLIQTLARLVAGLPVTLLEVNTIAHV